MIDVNLNKTQAKIKNEYASELNNFVKLLESEGYVMDDCGPYYHYEKEYGIKDKLKIIYGFHNVEKTRFFNIYRFKTGWALEIDKGCVYDNNAVNYDRFFFTDKVYYAFLSNSGAVDRFPKASILECFDTFKANVDDAFYKVMNEVMSIKWTKGIGNHDKTYPSGDGEFYENILKDIK